MGSQPPVCENLPQRIGRNLAPRIGVRRDSAWTGAEPQEANRNGRKGNPPIPGSPRSAGATRGHLTWTVPSSWTSKRNRFEPEDTSTWIPEVSALLISLGTAYL